MEPSCTFNKTLTLLNNTLEITAFLLYSIYQIDRIMVIRTRFIIFAT